MCSSCQLDIELWGPRRAQVSAVEDALLRRMFVAGGLRDELTRARNFYMLTTGAQRPRRSAVTPAARSSIAAAPRIGRDRTYSRQLARPISAMESFE